MNYKLEYAKYLKSPIHCIESNFEVYDGTQKKYVPYKLFPQQLKLIYSYDTYLHNLVAKPRQAGISTTTAAYIAVKIALASKEEPVFVEVLANKLDQSIEFVSKIRMFLLQIPIWVWGNNCNFNKEKEKYIVGKGAAKRLDFVNGSYVAAKPCTKDALRGTSPTYLVIDEAAFVENGKETYAAAAAATATGGKIIMISTPNGMDELYYKTYVGALDNKNDFNIVRLHWALDPRYNKDLIWQLFDNNDNIIEELEETDFTEESILKNLSSEYKPTSSWFRKMCRDLNNDKRAIAQELEVQFQGSGGNVIDNKDIEWYERTITKEPIIKEGVNKDIWIWEHPKEGHKYVAGIDTSSSEGKDYKTLSIIDTDDKEVVVEYKGKDNDEKFANIINHYCTLYSALTVIDTTGGYADLLIHFLELKDFKFFYKKITEKGDILIENEKAGFKIQSDRPAAISWFISLISNRVLKCYSIRQVNEWKTFIWKNGRADHQSGFNDDLIMSLVIALWISEKVYDKLEKAKNMSKKMVSSYLGINITSSEIEKRKKMSKKDIRNKNLKEIHGNNAWLFY